MSLHVITAPTVAVVTTAEAKAFLRVDHADDDAVISTMIAAVSDWLAGPNGWLGRSLAEQTLELRQPCFPHFGAIALPRPPLLAVESVKYDDTDGVEQTLSASIYEIYTGSDALPRVSLKDGESWPSTATAPEAVRVRYIAGYTDGESPTGQAVPEGLRQALLMTVAGMYEYREGGLTVQDSMAKRLFGPYRIYS